MDNRATDENRDAFDTLMSAMEAFDQNPNADTRAALGEAKRRHAERTSPRPQAALG